MMTDLYFAVWVAGATMNLGMIVSDEADVPKEDRCPFLIGLIMICLSWFSAGAMIIDAIKRSGLPKPLPEVEAVVVPAAVSKTEEPLARGSIPPTSAN